MKKILFVIESLHLGGAEKSLVTLLNNLDYKKFEISLIIFKDGGIFKNLVPPEINIILNEYPRLNMKDRILFKTLKLLYKSKYHPAQLFWRIIKSKIEKHPLKYDIAIAYNQGFSTYYTASKIQAPIKYTWLNTDYKKAGYNIRFDFPFYQSFTKTIAVSKEAKEALLNEVKLLNKCLRIEVIQDILDENLIKKQSKANIKTPFKKDTINIVTVARLAKAKGIHLAIKSCKELIKKGYDINWYIIGEGSERKKLESLITLLNLEKNFLLLGAKENPYPYINACDIYVQPSLFEGLGLTIIEATILSKPIVSTNFVTVSSIIKHNETGLISDMNSNSISKNIEILIQDNKLMVKFIKNLKNKKNNDKEISLRKINKLLKIKE